jgi:hypothetical protein
MKATLEGKDKMTRATMNSVELVQAFTDAFTSDDVESFFNLIAPGRPSIRRPVCVNASESVQEELFTIVYPSSMRRR